MWLQYHIYLSFVFLSSRQLSVSVLFLLHQSAEFLPSTLQLPTSFRSSHIKHPVSSHIHHIRPLTCESPDVYNEQQEHWGQAEFTWIHICVCLCVCVQLVSLSWFEGFPARGNSPWSRWVRTSWGPLPTSKMEPASYRWGCRQVRLQTGEAADRWGSRQVWGKVSSLNITVMSVIHRFLWENVISFTFLCMLKLCVRVGGATGHDAALPLPAAGRSDPADPVLPRLPQDPEPADVPQPGRPLWAHQPAPPDGGGEEAQAKLLTHQQNRLKHERENRRRSGGVDSLLFPPPLLSAVVNKARLF